MTYYLFFAFCFSMKGQPEDPLSMGAEVSEQPTGRTSLIPVSCEVAVRIP